MQVLLNTVIPFAILLCVLVVIHEFGHFIVAKMLGIGVEVFSVGFGKRLWGFKIGDTDYRLSLVPLGGYVRFRGENLEMLQGKSDAPEDEFNSQPKWKRFLVALAGPVFNIAFALAIPTIAILIGFKVGAEQMQQPVVGFVTKGSAAEKAGLLAGDKILTFDNLAKPNWDDVRLQIQVKPEEQIPLTVDRKGQVLNLTLTPAARQIERNKVGEAGFQSLIPTKEIIVNSAESGKPAALAGIQAGDKIVGINGQSLVSWHQFKNALNESNGQPVAMKIVRGDQALEVQASPAQVEGEYRLGIATTIKGELVTQKTSSIIEAMRYGWAYNWRILRVTGIAFGQIFSGSRSVRDSVSGPIGMARETGRVYESEGWTGLIPWAAMISLNLGVFNLLPIPVLDGGMILTIFVEWLMGLIGLTMSLRFRERIQGFGLVIILALMVFVFGNDGWRLIEDKFGKKEPPAQVQPQQQSPAQPQAPAQAEQSPQPANK
ncbi:MAG: RIP metalloprotease RseP [Acidobacteria bacterium]|nr:RIP metalloprotease RseP [Acidobacteriota bacterium]